MGHYDLINELVTPDVLNTYMKNEPHENIQKGAALSAVLDASVRGHHPLLTPWYGAVLC